MLNPPRFALGARLALRAKTADLLSFHLATTVSENGSFAGKIGGFLFYISSLAPQVRPGVWNGRISLPCRLCIDSLMTGTHAGMTEQ